MCVCVSGRRVRVGRSSVCVGVCEWERGSVCVCVCVSGRRVRVGRGSVCVCVCEWEKGASGER